VTDTGTRRDSEPPAGASIRAARPADTPRILELIRELAVYERLADQVTADEAGIGRALFGEPRWAEALVGEVDGQVVAFALFFHNFSTFLGRPGLYLEDLYVQPVHRGRGLGRRLLAALAGIAVERGCGRMEWAVLDWNAPAIGFYDALGARPMRDWTVFRLTGDRLARLADAVSGPGDHPVSGMPVPGK
jgi:GNAT superfamily N-acetyltransferase